jgi:hypothetical protein
MKSLRRGDAACFDGPAAERGEPLVRTETPREARANAPVPARAGELPKPPPGPPGDKIAELVSRIEALERQMTALAGATRSPGGHIRISDIKAAVCRHYRLTAAGIEGRSRCVRVTNARHTAILSRAPPDRQELRRHRAFLRRARPHGRGQGLQKDRAAPSERR